MINWFEAFTTGCARFAGRPAMFGISALLSVAGFGAFVSGNDRILSGATLLISAVTLLLLPVLQATQDRDSAALQAKIDELIKIHAAARDDLIGLENRSTDEIERVRLSQDRA